MTDEGAVRLLQLGLALRSARTAANLTQSEVATRLGCTQGKIQKIETRPVSVSETDLDRMIELYRVPPEKADELHSLASRGRRGKPAGLSTKWSPFGQLSHLEPDAAEIYCWHCERIPGPLQSEQYMLQQHTDADMTPEIARQIRRRKDRAHIFEIADPPYYQAILSESSLLRMPGGYSPGLIVDQVEHLVQLMTRHERLTVQILLFDSSARFVDSDFQILRFAGDTPDFAYIEWPGGARSFRRPRDLKSFDEYWQELHAHALTREDTMEFLINLAEQASRTENVQATLDWFLFSRRRADKTV